MIKLVPQDVITEVLKYLLGEFLIGLLGFEALAGVAKRLHAAGALTRNWVTTGRGPAASEQAELDAALEEAWTPMPAYSLVLPNGCPGN